MKARESVPRTVADLLKRLGGVPASRVWLNPLPGTAAPKDVVHARYKLDRLCELVDCTLVEKAPGFYESCVSTQVACRLVEWTHASKRGIVLGGKEGFRLRAGLVRMPSCSFISRDRLPGRKIPRVEIPALAPDLAVEIPRRGNTRTELVRKLADYFDAGTRLVWVIHAKEQTAHAYTAQNASVFVGVNDALDRGDVLHGFSLHLRRLFNASFIHLCERTPHAPRIDQSRLLHPRHPRRPGRRPGHRRHRRADLRHLHLHAGSPRRSQGL